MIKKVLNTLMVSICVAAIIITPAYASGSIVEPQGKLNINLKKGDVNNNGLIEADDALTALKLVAGLFVQQDMHLISGDINRDGKISVRDAFEVLMNVADLKDDKLGYQEGLSDINYDVPDSFKEDSSIMSNAPIAFVGADGWGKTATGGRGGRIIEVTNLNDSGEGSLRAAVSASGSRIVVFKVSGVIYLQSGLSIGNGNLTIAGQTAPGDGITLADYGMSITGTNIIIRYIRVRPGDQEGKEQDGIDICAAKNVIIDHCSVSFATDETLSARPANSGENYDSVSDNISVQWCIISESITNSVNIGKRHGMGSLIRGAQGAKITYHHDMYSSHSSRLPMMGNYMYSDQDNGNFSAEFINNTVYNWAGSSASKCADADENGERINITNMNYIGNYYKQGPESTGSIMFSEGSIGNHMYVEGNMMDGVMPEDQKSLIGFTSDVLATSDNPYFVKSGKVIDQEAYFLKSRFEHSIMTGIEEAQIAHDAVADYAGCSLSRDTFDTAITKAMKEGNGTLIDQTYQSLGWIAGKPVSNTGTEYEKWMQNKYPDNACYEAYTDTDKDGMSDAWEDAMGLNKNDVADGSAKYKTSEYTNLDVFLQFLVENPEAAINH